MHRRVPAALAAILLAVSMVTVAGPVAARGPQSAHDRIVAHWSPERMKAARPRDFVREANGRLERKGKPGGGAGGAVTGASWTKGGDILKRSGKVYFEMGGSGWLCSGTVVTDHRSTVSLVLTAGHCAVDETTGQFATNWLFIPEFDSAPTFTCSATKWGCWTAEALVVHRGFAEAGSFNDEAVTHDFALAIVGPGGKTSTSQDQLDAKVGSFPLTYDRSGSPATVVKGQQLYAFGYPAAGKYKGKDLTYCAGAITEDANTANRTWGMACNMTGGSSGGPWLTNVAVPSLNTSGSSVGSLNSYGYAGQSVMYGPKFNDDTLAVYTKADAATTMANSIVP